MNHMYIYLNVCQQMSAQSAGAVEYLTLKTAPQQREKNPP